MRLPDCSPKKRPRLDVAAMTLLTSLSAALMPCAAARADDAPAAASASAAESAPDAAGNAAEKPAFTIEVQTANEELKTLLERHNDLRRYQSVPDLDAAELDRLMALAESGLKGLLAAQGYFSPQITLTRQAAAKGQPPVVRIAVEPGEQAKVEAADIAFAGDIAHSADPAAAEQQKAIREDWALSAGKGFTQEAWSSAKSGALRQLIAKRYPAGRIGRSQADVDEAARSVKLAVTLDSGPLYRLGPVQVTGNRRYPAFLPGRLAQLAVGEPYDQARLADAQQRLISSGYYDAAYVSVDPQERSESEGQDENAAPAAVTAPVQMQVTEAPLKKATLGLGFTTDGGPRITLEHRHNRVPWLGWRAVSKAQLEAANTFIESDLLAMPAASGWRWGALAKLSRVKDSDLTTYNRQLRFGRSQSRERSERNFYVQYDLSRVKGADGQYVTDEMTGDGSALSFNFIWTTRRFNHLSDPTGGWGLGFELGGGITINGKRQPFTRGVARWLGYIPLGRSAASSRLAVRAEAGAVISPDGARVPSALLFRAGGDNSVRGYGWRDIGIARGGITAPGHYMMTASLEWQRPILNSEGRPSGIEYIAFIDAGDVAENPGSLTPRLGIGTGARVKTPVGPMTAAIAYGAKTRKFRLHLSVGFVF